MPSLFTCLKQQGFENTEMKMILFFKPHMAQTKAETLRNVI